MKRYSSPAARVLAGGVAFLMAFALAAPPAVAAEAEGEVPSPTESQTLDSPTAEQPTLVAMAEARVQSAGHRGRRADRRWHRPGVQEARRRPGHVAGPLSEEAL